MTAKIIELDPAADPRLESLSNRIREEIDNSVQGTDITYASIIGLIEIIKSDLIDELKS